MLEPSGEDRRLAARSWGWLGALVWALAAGVLASQLTIPLAVASAVVAVVAGVFLGAPVAASRVRFSSLWIGLVLSWFLVLWVCWALRSGTLGSALLGPVLAYTASECLGWLVLPLVTVMVLRASSLRYRSYAVLEVGAVATVLAGIFAGHREGFINRPFFLVDPIWAQGLDPLPAFLAIGAGIAAMVVILVATQRSERRSFLDLALLLVMIVGIFAILPEEKLKDIPKIREQLAGTSNKKKKEDQRPSQARGSGTPAPGQESQSKDGKGSGQTPQDWDDLQFNNAADKPSNAPVAVVLLHSDHDPASDFYYFRQTAFSQYNGQRLVRDTSGRADLDLADYFPIGTLDLPHPALEQGAEQELDTTVAMLTRHTRPFGLVDAEQFIAAPNPDVRRFQQAYDVKSQVLTRGLLQLLTHPTGVPAATPTAPSDPNLLPFTSGYGLPSNSNGNYNASAEDETLRQHYLEAPPDPRYKQLADDIVSKLRPALRDNPVARAGAIKVWLEKNGIYSLNSKYESSDHPVEDFLFGDRTGYCVFFAHAAVYLMRTAGIPARVGAGYAVSARNRGSGSALLVRERDSHAWPEIYLQDVGWVVVDIVPERSVAPPEDPPDAGMQQMLGDMARHGPGNPEDEKRQGHGDLQEMLRKLLLFLWHALLPLLGMFIASMYVAKVYRRMRPYLCDDRQLPILAFQATLDGLADMGRVRRFGQTREDFARGQASVAPGLVELTRLHLVVTLGERTVPINRGHVIQLYEKTVGDGVRATRWYRRLWGWLNPFSWWRVK